MRLEHHLHIVGGYVRYISPYIIIIIIIIIIIKRENRSLNWLSAMSPVDFCARNQWDLAKVFKSNNNGRKAFPAYMYMCAFVYGENIWQNESNGVLGWWLLFANVIG